MRVGAQNSDHGRPADLAGAVMGGSVPAGAMQWDPGSLSEAVKKATVSVCCGCYNQVAQTG